MTLPIGETLFAPFCSILGATQDTRQESPSKSRALMPPTAASGDGVKLRPIPRKVENEDMSKASSVIEYWKSYLCKNSGGLASPSGRGVAGTRAKEVPPHWSSVEAQEPEPRSADVLAHRAARSDSVQSGDVKSTPLRDVAVSGPQGTCDSASQEGGEGSPIHGARGTDDVDVADRIPIRHDDHLEPGDPVKEPWKRVDPGTRTRGERALASSWTRADETARDGDVDASAPTSMGDDGPEPCSRSLGHGEEESIVASEIAGQRTPSPPALEEEGRHVWRPASNDGVGETIQRFRGTRYGDGSCPSVSSSAYALGYRHIYAEPPRHYGEACDYRSTSTGDDEVAASAATATDVMRSCESAHEMMSRHRDRGAHRSAGSASFHDSEAPLYPFFSAAGTRRARADYGGVNVFRLGGSRWDGAKVCDRPSMEAIDRGHRPRQQDGRGAKDMDLPLSVSTLRPSNLPMLTP